MTHSGTCSKDCGHALSTGHILASQTALIEQTLNRDPRVVEYYDIEDGTVIEFVYAYNRRSVAAIHKASARQLGIRELA